MSGENTTFEWVTDEERFLALQPEWDQLWQRTVGRRFSRSFTWFLTGWRTTGRPRGRRLRVLVARQSGQAVLIWPMALRRRWFGVEAIALGPEFTEYDPVLVADGPDAADFVRTAWAHLRAHGQADLIKLSFVRDGSSVHGVLAADSTTRSVETLPSPYVVWDDFDNWDAYWRSRGRNVRNGVRRRARRLGELGQIAFGRVEDPAEFAALLDWCLEIKREWIAEKGLKNDFLHTREFQAFLTALHASRAPRGQWVMFALKIDGRTVSAEMGALDARRYEGFVSVQDPEFAKFSVGTIVLVKTLEWLAARGLRYDFRIGDEPYKRDWANRDRPVTTFALAVTPMGAAALAFERWKEGIRRAKDRVRVAIPQRFRAKAKVWARSRLSSLGLRAGERQAKGVVAPPAGSVRLSLRIEDFSKGPTARSQDRSIHDHRHTVRPACEV